ncbi:MAG TPA: CorA family divalent cation transporter [Rhizomicrobium sp.]|nr:CorA family divalent cation transporter [Rhizomicrobium sp.]
MHHILTKNPGLLWGLAVVDGKAERMIDETAADVLAQPQDWCWMHFALSDHRARRFIENFEAVPQAARALLLSGETRPQIHLTATCAYGVIPDIEKDFDGQSLGAGRLAFWLDAEYLVTARHHPMRVAEEVHAQSLAGPPPASPALAFVRLNEHYVAVVEQRLAVLTHLLDTLEDQVLSDRADLDQSKLGPARREIARYHREFASLRTAYHRATSGRGAFAQGPVAEHLPALAQAAEDVDRDAAALTERARLLFEEMDARISANANRSLQTLTILSTLLLPPTFIAGAFGMNVPAIPWANDHGGFWWAIGLCTVVVAASWAALKRYGIL